jgi:hypothetical protein
MAFCNALFCRGLWLTGLAVVCWVVELGLGDVVVLDWLGCGFAVLTDFRLVLI